MIKANFVCGYCGKAWKDSAWSLAALNKTCPICKEKKNIRAYKDKDYFGYDEKEVIDLDEQLKFGDE